eukprot:403334605
MLVLLVKYLIKLIPFYWGAPSPVNLTSTLTLGLLCEELARGRSSLFAPNQPCGDHSGGTYLALRVDVYFLSSWIRLLSNLLVQIRRFYYRNDPISDIYPKESFKLKKIFGIHIPYVNDEDIKAVMNQFCDQIELMISKVSLANNLSFKLQTDLMQISSTELNRGIRSKNIKSM